MPAKKAVKKTPAKKVVKKEGKKSTKKVAKKPVKKIAKKAVKKTPAKAKKVDTKGKVLVYANNNQSFWMTDGQILNSLLALRDALSEMEKEVYAYHANGWQNDFAQWVEIVLGDSGCASDLRKAKTANSARTVVVKHLKLYTL